VPSPYLASCEIADPERRQLNLLRTAAGGRVRAFARRILAGQRDLADKALAIFSESSRIKSSCRRCIMGVPSKEDSRSETRSIAASLRGCVSSRIESSLLRGSKIVQ